MAVVWVSILAKGSFIWAHDANKLFLYFERWLAKCQNQQTLQIKERRQRYLQNNQVKIKNQSLYECTCL